MPVSVEEHTSTIPVVLLGSTGSIGTQAREVIEAHSGRFDVIGVSAGGASAPVVRRSPNLPCRSSR